MPTLRRTPPSNEESSKPQTKSFNAKDFARRLDTAVSGHPLAPPGHGRQRWLRDLIKDRTGTELSPEAVRKWFAGEARPRPDVMKKIAMSLEVDEAWLALGISPTETPREAKQRNATADGAVNLVAGLIQMGGGHIAFGDDNGPDIHAIINGKKVDIEVKMARDTGGSTLMFTLSQAALQADAVIGVVPMNKGLGAKLLWFTPEIIKENGRRKGGYVEIMVDHSGPIYTAGKATVPQVNSFKALAG
jgi:hypothetical protein